MSSITIDLPDPPHNAPPLEKRVEDYFERITPLLKTALQEAFRQWLDGKPADHARKKPFAMPFEEFEKLSEAEKSETRWQAFSRNQQWINEQLRKYRAEWIVVLGGKVEKFSPTLNDLRTKTEIKKMGREKGLAPFLFIREPLIEEIKIESATQAPWAALDDDSYPAIRSQHDCPIIWGATQKRIILKHKFTFFY
jgi:hypothetical protein